ncbi:MAG: DUF4835 family protein [Chlorobi bacterium]|nr:DUF4835 family protein [Chlorobiota bacterium]
MNWKNIYSILLAFWFWLPLTGVQAQEFKATVTVDASALPTSNLPVFKTLEKDLTTLINKRHWTKKIFRPEERIECNFYIVLHKVEGNNYEAELNVSAYRPVYNSTYKTLTLSVSDKNFKFSYQQYQPLEYNEFSFDSNLTGTIAYYLYMILGYDFDSFKTGAGKPYFEQAQKIAEMASGTGAPGWEHSGKFFSRINWVNQILDPQNTQFHNAFYTYHRLGLDQMADKPREAKTQIIHALQQMTKLSSSRAGLLLRLFFDAKADEIVQIFSEGPVPANQKLLKNLLMELAPFYQYKWEKIRY